MKQSAVIKWGVRSRVRMWGWPVALAVLFTGRAAIGAFRDMRPAFVLPWDIWALVGVVALWGLWESRRSAQVVGRSRRGTTFQLAIFFFALAASSFFELALSTWADDAVLTPATIGLGALIPIAAKSRRLKAALLLAFLAPFSWMGLMLMTVPFRSESLTLRSFMPLLPFSLAIIGTTLLATGLAWWIFRVSEHLKSTPNCPTCDYDVRMLVTCRCPECGNIFDPGIAHRLPTRQASPVGPWRAIRSTAMLAVLILAVACGHPNAQRQYHTQVARARAAENWAKGEATVFRFASSTRQIGAHAHDMITGLQTRGMAMCGSTHWTVRFESREEHSATSTIAAQRRAKWTAPSLMPTHVTQLLAHAAPPKPESTLAENLTVTRDGALRFNGGTIDEYPAAVAAVTDGTGRLVISFGTIAAVFSREGDWLQAFELVQGAWTQV